MMTNGVEAEQAVIGSILLDGRCLPVVEELLRAEDFALESDRQIYRAAVKLAREDKPVDLVTILEEVRSQHADVSSEYLMQLLEITPTAANVEVYARQVREQSVRRAIRSLGEELQQRVDEHDETAALLADAGRRIEDLQTEGVTGDLLAPNDALLAFFAHRQRVEEGTASGFVPTGFRDIDILLGGGMLSSGMYILAARPGMGKTTVALNIADRVAERTGPVLFVSLEMDEEQLMAKRLSRLSGIPGHRLLMDKLTEPEGRRLAEASSKLSRLPVHISQRPGVMVDDIALLARKVKGVKLLVVDYIGKITPGQGAQRKNRIEYMTEISGALKTLARTLRIPVLVLCQLNRQTEGQSDKVPQLAHLRDTGAIEQDADGVIFLYREDYYAEKKPSGFDPSPLEVIVAKNRHGSTGKCEMAACLALSKINPVSNDPRRAWRAECAAGN
ncbi:replicative DNA helicase [Pseudoflavonifractor sp. DSM 107456]|uniref:DNA 5'-3' helicase n=1 Tax=Pseudoflavonifractor gallinarum TaxID=2779352 RepID=A0ABR9RC72_9FIRM|nr:replicative DNA helicase [Pseudoflavonifractor gallinarum]MBE5056249.1 replicative DNA helicase [Pseudoflavonifractor gallinarum]